MFEIEKELLKKLCQKSNPARQAALEDELCFNGVRFENWADMAIITKGEKQGIALYRK